jgi:16S rRNA (guanine527-N7)-methyltransferase
MNLPEKYFPDLTHAQLEKYAHMESLYREWNAMINVISRKDIDQLATHHILHSLAIAKVISFMPGSCIMDAGSGGGFPGIPLAVMFPETRFTLVDSIGKKVRVIETIARELGLENVTTIYTRFETVKGNFDFVTGRAVSKVPIFVSMLKHCIRKNGINHLPNGILYLTGGEVEQDLSQVRAKWRTWPLSDFFQEDYFASKKLVHLHNFS